MLSTAFTFWRKIKILYTFNTRFIHVTNKMIYFSDCSNKAPSFAAASNGSSDLSVLKKFSSSSIVYDSNRFEHDLKLNVFEGFESFKTNS